jgi:hypothetical protein
MRAMVTFGNAVALTRVTSAPPAAALVLHRPATFRVPEKRLPERRPGRKVPFLCSFV